MGGRKKAILVNEAELKSLIDGLELKDKKERYLRARWLNWLWWTRARRQMCTSPCAYRRIAGAGAGAHRPARPPCEDAWIFAVGDPASWCDCTGIRPVRLRQLAGETAAADDQDRGFRFSS
jgi:hypothetical protein